MVFPAALILAFSMFLQVDWASSFKGDAFTSKEIEKLEKERDINDRIKIYTNAAKRIQKRLDNAVSRKQYQFVPRDLELWTALLTNSLGDIEANINPKKKSKNLIKLEIEVRKALDNMQDYRIKAPIDQQDAFETCLTQTELIRKKFVEIIFPR